MTEKHGLEAIKDKEKVPSVAWLARELGLTRSAVQQWKMVPAERIIEIERITGIPRQKLRPDLYENLKRVRATA